MLQMLSQLMGQVQPGSDGIESSPAGLPPGLAALMGSGNGNAAGGSQMRADRRDAVKYDYIWKTAHALFAFCLGIYVLTASTAFSNPLGRLSRKSGGFDTQNTDGINLFWSFTTIELVLQSTRYFLERGRTSSGIGGMMGTISAVLPEPWAKYLRLIARYSGIWSTVVGK